MIISFLMPSRFEGRPARHLLVFYKQLHALGREGLGFVGESDYFRAPAALRAEGRPEWEPSWRETFEYEPPANLDGVASYALPPDLFAPRLARVRSPWRMYGHLVTRRFRELEVSFTDALDTLANGRPIEAVLAFANVPSVQHVARLRGLPVVHTHFAALRRPAYTMTGYWDRRGVNSRTDALRRFQAFRREASRAQFPLFSREELLRTVRRTPMPEGPAAGEAPFRVGVGLQGEENAYVHGFGALDLIAVAHQQAGREDVLIRNHPGAVTFYADSFGVKDDSADATEFILKCQKVITVNSGLALEAMLLGRDCLMLADSPFRLAIRRSSGATSPRRGRDHRQLLALNFLVFGYLVPYALMFDPEYMRWRLTNPPELEIVRHHQHWYRRHLTTLPGRAEPALAVTTSLKLLQASHGGEGRRPLIVFGAGQATPGMIEQLRDSAFNLAGIFDNDEGKWGSRVAGLTIGPPSYKPDTTILVSSLTHTDQIVQQLGTLGYAAAHVLRVL